MMSEDTSENEYALQYFGFSPEMFYKDFSELIIEEISDIVKQSIAELPTLESTSETKEKLHQGIMECHAQWCNDSMAILKNAEPVIKSFFTIPKNVLLESDSMHQTSYSEDEVQHLEKEVAELESQYAEQIKFISYSEALLSKIDSYEPQIKQVDEATATLEPIVQTINEIIELEKVAELCRSNYSQLVDNKNDDDSDSEESEYQSRFKVVED